MKNNFYGNKYKTIRNLKSTMNFHKMEPRKKISLFNNNKQRKKIIKI